MDFQEKKYVLNNAYRLKNDLHRMFICNNYTSYYNPHNTDPKISKDVLMLTHPYLAYIIGLFDGTNTIKDIYEKLNSFFSISESKFNQAIKALIYNNEVLEIPITGIGTFKLPKRLLIEASPGCERHDLSLNDIDIDNMINKLDLLSKRLYIPESMMLMIDNHCLVNCTYCYEDRQHKIDRYISFERITEIIQEATSIGMSYVDIIGGDILMYPFWDKLVKCLKQNQYAPYISTKVPITDKIIQKLKDDDINSIQLSLDSVIPSELTNILHVGKNYFELIKKGIGLLNKANIEIIIRSVITRYNDSIESIEKLISFASSFKMVSKVDLVPAAYSRFSAYNYSSTIAKLNIIESHIKQWEDRYQLKISLANWIPEYTDSEKPNRFKNRAQCIANMTSMFMLPDGKVTICEQLYWHPFFIIGDLAHQSIMEVWNSDKALSLWNFSQKDVQEGSPCKTCQNFNECRHGRGVCWRDAVAYFGSEYYDYPPTFCPKATLNGKKYFIPQK